MVPFAFSMHYPFPLFGEFKISIVKRGSHFQLLVPCRHFLLSCTIPFHCLSTLMRHTPRKCPSSSRKSPCVNMKFSQFQRKQINHCKRPFKENLWSVESKVEIMTFDYIKWGCFFHKWNSVASASLTQEKPSLDRFRTNFARAFMISSFNCRKYTVHSWIE